MATISAALVKELRTKTGAGMGDCKKALIETDGDVEKAVDVLRAKGVKASQAQRETGEGAVMLKASDDGKGVAIVELGCETDFAARNENFQALLHTVADTVLAEKCANADEAKGHKAVADGLQEAAAITIRENIQLKRAEYRALEGEGKIGTYVHHNGRVGVAIALNTPAGADVDGLLKDLAMHTTAHIPNPVAVAKDNIPEELVAREKAVALAAIDQNEKDKSKPQNIKEKMVEGKLRKFFEERALLEQKFVRDPSQKISQLLAAKGKELGGDLSIAWFTRVEIGG